MSLRIALAGISHETNTYCAGFTPKEAFYTYRGQRLLDTAGQESDVGGAVDACARIGAEAVPILFASTQPSGIIERSAYESFKDEILEGLAAGTIDIVIGTHRVAGADVHFARLGLVVIDEEQRFGVEVKERLKAVRASVDVLTMTATPGSDTTSSTVWSSACRPNRSSPVAGSSRTTTFGR